MPVGLLLVPEPKGLGLSGNSFILLGVLGRVLSMELMAKLGGAETIAGLLPRASMKLVADLAESMRHGLRTIEGSTGRLTPIRAGEVVVLGGMAARLPVLRVLGNETPRPFVG